MPIIADQELRLPASLRIELDAFKDKVFRHLLKSTAESYDDDLEMFVRKVDSFETELNDRYIYVQELRKVCAASRRPNPTIGAKPLATVAKLELERHFQALYDEYAERIKIIPTSDVHDVMAATQTIETFGRRVQVMEDNLVGLELGGQSVTANLASASTQETGKGPVGLPISSNTIFEAETLLSIYSNMKRMRDGKAELSKCMAAVDSATDNMMRLLALKRACLVVDRLLTEALKDLQSLMSQPVEWPIAAVDSNVPGNVAEEELQMRRFRRHRQPRFGMEERIKYNSELLGFETYCDVEILCINGSPSSNWCNRRNLNMGDGRPKYSDLR